MNTVWPGIAAVLLIAGCTQPEGGEAAEETAAGEEEPEQALTPVDTEPAVEAPALAPLSQAEIEAELEAGAGCSLEQDGKALLVAVEGDAIARPYGTLRHMTFEVPQRTGNDGERPSELNALYDGGSFHAGAIRIQVLPEEGEGETIGEVTFRNARVVITEENEGSGEMEGEWHCGA